MIRGGHQTRRVLILLLAALVTACGGTSGALEGHDPGTLHIEGDQDEVTLDVAIVDDPFERAVGLMGVEELGETEGMVFLPGELGEGTFTMRGTLIPLSLGVWGPDLRIRAVLDMVPCEAEPCPTYDPGVEWLGAVEVNRGFFARNDVGVGDAVRLER